jgi:hypothetical protein
LEVFMAIFAEGKIEAYLRYVILDERSSAAKPLGDAVETFIRSKDAERFVEEVQSDEPEVAQKLRIEEREIEW